MVHSENSVGTDVPAPPPWFPLFVADFLQHMAEESFCVAMEKVERDDSTSVPTPEQTEASYHEYDGSPELRVSR